MNGDLNTLGWQSFAPEPSLRRWIDAAKSTADQRANDPELIEKWLRCGQTWFVGADVLGNDPQGQVARGIPFSGAAIDAAKQEMGATTFDWGPGQVSVCYPGYPKRDHGENEASYNFRVKRDAAHLDGLKPVGTPARRFFEEFHGTILGIPFGDYDDTMSPVVVWEGSHRIIRDWLKEEFHNYAPQDWHRLDLTEAYQRIRRHVFETCKRVELTVPLGGAYIVHKLAIHGVAPWRSNCQDPRTIVYFRPFWTGDKQSWLND